MELSISRKSAIFKVAQYGGLSVYDRADLCSVFWRFMWGALKVPAMIGGAALLGAGLLFVVVMLPIIQIVAWFSEGLRPDPLLFSFHMFAWCALAFIGYSFWMDMTDRPNVAAKTLVMGASSAASLVAAGYRGWKSKTCVLVAVK